ncbi:aldehyde dehydrogenase family protein [Streptomyces gilvus]|uniref:aldehyde dehydrogenase family protein n=1 Tax=Streptomyces gilvus TaxID=2920937 RepID=UPI001F0E21C9|nr:aldehyde dehydrogenase family protein [Streptomyces sp. CME 23]MCH5675646.1 aldehyde dehydrogenase family protein [Streptomyces sp. CME 23]
MTADVLLVAGEPRMLIDGTLVESVTGATYPNIDPATEEVLGHVTDGGVEDADRAVAAARHAFDSTDWAHDHAFRAHCLRQLQDVLRSQAETFRRIDTAETGRPFSATPLSVDVYIDELGWYADHAESYPWIQARPDVHAFGARHLRSVRREPVGVVAAITTWNCGFFLNLTKTCSALAAGNTVVLKPAPETPWQATEFGRLIAERTDIPPGVVNVVTGTSPSVAQRLTEHPGVDMITFTGSTAVGRRIMGQAATTLKRLALELGGKSAAVVLPDADLPAAVTLITRILCGNAGQTCAAPTRLLLPRSRYEEGVEAATSALAAVSVGNPWDPATGQGPQISAAQRERVLRYVEAGRAEGLRLTTGGGRPERPDRGWFVEPTLFADVPRESALFREEIFGPVLVATPYDDRGGVEEAVSLANDSEYGLHAAVFGADTDRASAVAQRLRVGSVSINAGQFFGVDVPFGGRKQSGIGRERGVEGFEEFLETKTVAVPARTQT